MLSFGPLETFGIVLIVLMLLGGVWRYYAQRTDDGRDAEGPSRKATRNWGSE
jgi:hypothetical protein